MSRESDLDQTMRELIHKMVHVGPWTQQEKAQYDHACIERARLMTRVRKPKCAC